jgi:predicted mannosyl-3-phosphoglycerate phosphatase (HAD superfamily)
MHFTTNEIVKALSKMLPNLDEKDLEDFMSITTYKNVNKNVIIYITSYKILPLKFFSVSMILS